MAVRPECTQFSSRISSFAVAFARNFLLLAPVVASCGAVVGGAVSGHAGDWPQLLGPNRNGVAVDESAIAPWPATGPKLLWSESVGSGYAGVAVRDRYAVAFHRLDDSEVVSALDRDSGKTIWKQTLPATYQGGVDADKGPRCTPTITKDAVVVLGAARNLACLELADGKIRWTLDLKKQYQSDDGYFGAGSTPLVLEDRVIVPVGSRKTGLIALSLADGKVLWESTKYDASYSSPVLCDFQGKSIVVSVLRLNVVGIDPADGTVLFDFPFGQRGPTVNAATPIMVSNRHLLLTASYGIGAALIDLATAPPTVVYRNPDLISSQYTTPVRIGALVVGTDGREDMGGASLVCIDPLSEKVLWTNAEFGVSHTVAVGDQVIAVGTDGKLKLLKIQSEKYSEQASFDLPLGSYRAVPAFSKGKLYIRSSSGEKSRIDCYLLN